MLGLLRKFTKLAVSGSLQGPRSGTGLRNISATKPLRAAEDFQVSPLWDANRKKAVLVVESKRNSAFETLMYYEVVKNQLNVDAKLETVLEQTATGVEPRTIVKMPIDIDTQTKLAKSLGDVISVPNDIIQEECDSNKKPKM